MPDGLSTGPTRAEGRGPEAGEGRGPPWLQEPGGPAVVCSNELYAYTLTPVTVPELVRKLRLDAGLSLREVAAVSELAISTIHRTERGELHPTVDTLERIVSATGHRLRLDPRPDSAGSVLGLSIVLRRELSEQAGLSVVRRAAELASRFDAAPNGSRARMLLAEPPSVGSVEWDAFLGGFAEWLAARSGMEAPAWTGSPSRFLDRGWWVTPMVSMRAWEFAGTPVSLQRRGVFLHRESLTNR